MRSLACYDTMEEDIGSCMWDVRGTDEPEFESLHAAEEVLHEGDNLSDLH